VLRRLLLGALMLGLAVVVVQSLPDIARYIKIREM
jgi:Family of unknown function (DUF6893)